MILVSSKTILRSYINNEIVYIESNKWPLEIRIVKQQLKFWLSMQNIMMQNPKYYISKLVRLGENTAYIKYYKVLTRVHISPESCNKTLKNDFMEKFVTKIRHAAELDVDSKLGTYLLAYSRC